MKTCSVPATASEAASCTGVERLTPTSDLIIIGLGFQVFFVGADAGVDPLELLDLVTGLFLVDLRADDL